MNNNIYHSKFIFVYPSVTYGIVHKIISIAFVLPHHSD